MVLPRWLPRHDAHVESLSFLYTRLYSALRGFCNNTVTDARHFGYCICQITSRFYYIIIIFTGRLRNYGLRILSQRSTTISCSSLKHLKETFPTISFYKRKSSSLESNVRYVNWIDFLATEGNIGLRPVRIVVELCANWEVRKVSLRRTRGMGGQRQPDTNLCRVNPLGFM